MGYNTEGQSVLAMVQKNWLHWGPDLLGWPLTISELNSDFSQNATPLFHEPADSVTLETL